MTQVLEIKNIEIFTLFDSTQPEIFYKASCIW